MRPRPSRGLGPLVVCLAAFLSSACGRAPTTTAAPGPGGASIDDPETLHVVVTANAIDIEMARLADGRAESPVVLRFAAAMISDHTAVNGRAEALARRLGVEPRDNPVSRSLRQDAAPVIERLRGLRGLDFDRAYLAREVGYHENVLEAMDGVLLPNVRNEALRALLVEVRPAFETHLRDARDARVTLR